MIPRKLPRPWALPGVALLLVLVACPALAHRVNVFAYVEGGDVVVECSYSRSQRVRHGEVDIVNAATGVVYLTGQTDEQGAFRFPVPPTARAAKADLRIVLKAGEGHQNDTVIKAEEYLAAAPTVPGAAPTLSAPTQAVAGTAPTAPGVASVPESSTGPTPGAKTAATAPAQGGALQPGASGPVVDQAALQAIVEAAVEKKIAPLRAMLVAEKEKGPGLTEIIGGIGWLVGLAGIAAYAGGRRGRPGA